MSAEFVFHTWVNLDFSKKKIIAHNENGYSALAAHDGTIMVWHQSTEGPSFEEGEIICFILNTFSRIERLSWVIEQNILVVHEPEKITLWDIFLNEEIDTITTKYQVHFVKQVENGYLFVLDNGKLIYKSTRYNWRANKPCTFVVNIGDNVICYPHYYTMEKGEWVARKIPRSLNNRRIRRRFEQDNSVKISGDFVFIGEEPENASFQINKGYRHYFDRMDIVVVTQFSTGFSVQTFGYTVYHSRETNTTVAIPGQNVVPFEVKGEEPYMVFLSDKYYKVVKKRGKIGLVDLNATYLTREIGFDNVLPSLFVDPCKEIKFYRMDLHMGYVWAPDLENDYLFIDLLKREGSIFTSVPHDYNAVIMVDENSRYLLDWRRGKHYPSGKLYYRNLEHPEDDPILLYDVEVSTKRIGSDEFVEGVEGVDYPLIIPEWHLINLKLVYCDVFAELQLSLSQYFMVLEHWSKFHGIKDVQFPDTRIEANNFLRFGDIEVDGKTVEGAAPIWDQNDRFVAIYHKDSNIYVLDKSDPHLLPYMSVNSTLPALIEFSPDGAFLVVVSFSLKSTYIKTHPQDQNATYVETNFPYLSIQIINLETKSLYRKTSRFPLYLDKKEIQTEYSQDEIRVIFPSYSDIRSNKVCTFYKTSIKFSVRNQSKYYRFWHSFTKHSPHSLIGKGSEFPAEKHPEIKREYAMSPCHVYEYQLLRKNDGCVISNVSEFETVHQESSSEVYALEGTISLDLPFYAYNIRKPVFISKEFAKLISKDKLLELDYIEKIPSSYTYKLDLTESNPHLLKRVDGFIDIILDAGEVHSKHGIAMKSPRFDFYRARLEIEQESLRTALDFFEQV